MRLWAAAPWYVPALQTDVQSPAADFTVSVMTPLTVAETPAAVLMQFAVPAPPLAGADGEQNRDLICQK